MKNNRKAKAASYKRSRLIAGKHCLMELLKKAPKRVTRVYLATKEGALIEKLRSLNIEVIGVSREEIAEMTKCQTHQGVAAYVVEKKEPRLEEYLEESFNRDSDLLLALDSITDPQNLGTLLRAAECFGAGAVLWSKNRGVDLTPTVSKASVGASELLPIIRVSNLVEAVRSCKKEGYRVVTAEVGKGSTSLPSFRFPKKTLLVVGSEGEGVRELLSKQADERVTIPMCGEIDSLNVSQATAVLLYTIACQREAPSCDSSLAGKVDDSERDE